ncbi:class III lanthipeptide [Shewanella sp. SR44-3]
MKNILKLQTLAVDSDVEVMEWSTISNHCGGNVLR